MGTVLTENCPHFYISRFEGRTKAFVKVQDGCDNFCSYCKVPLARGRSRSRGTEEIINETSTLVSNGYKEIVLTGICLGDWGRGFNLSLCHLLEEIERRVSGAFRVRLSSIEPWYVSEALIRKISCSDKICKHLHIPMQSGDAAVLKRMNRDFSPEDFSNLITLARGFMPDAAFSTDILVGFPGETEKEFNNTLKLTELTRPSRAHIFPFSGRRGTPAFGLKDQVPYYIIAGRIRKVKALTDRFAHEYAERFKGKPSEVLVETRRDPRTGLLAGYTDNYIRAYFQGPDELMGNLQVVPLTNV
ncbi:MAG: MiaB/RimO family radical SAM methylthiotransferase, partial [Candidatus Omnitrophica bacterium]|nr:MiaB/RimO family radical SAM methylthiotransferase [Candidatus Omnitrophota bacterium]